MIKKGMPNLYRSLFKDQVIKDLEIRLVENDPRSWKEVDRYQVCFLSEAFKSASDILSLSCYKRKVLMYQPIIYKEVLSCFDG